MSVTRAIRQGQRQSAAHHALRVKLITAKDPEFDQARLPWNLAVDQRPAAIASPASVDEVAAAVRLAREQGLRIAPQGTGHGAAAMGSLEDTVLLKTDRLRAVEVDPATRVVRVEAGATWSDAVTAAGEYGLALPAGSSPDVGVVGYTLGGGLGWLSRRLGIACNLVEAIELVTADGRHHRVDAQAQPDLFWALRGGGGSFGVVTAVEFRAAPISSAYAGWLWWPSDRGREVLHCWRELTQQGMPDELTTVARYLTLPEMPEVPEPLRGRSLVAVEVFHLGVPAEADALIAPLRALGPENDTLAVVPIPRLTYLHMDPEHPVPGVGDGMLLAELPEAAVEEFVGIAGAEADSPLLSVEIRQLGGAIARGSEANGVLRSIDAPYVMFALGVAPTPQSAVAVRAGVDRLLTGMSPWAAPRMYLNFAETRRDSAALWGANAHRRLAQVKKRVDPENLIRANHPVVDR